LDINGDIKNIKAHVLEKLQALYAVQLPIGQISTNELNEKLLEITGLLNREVAVYINRSGKILQVSVGDTATVDLPAFKSRTNVRLSGIRCIHTHPSGDSMLSEPDSSSLRRLRFDVMMALARTKDSGDILGSVAFFTGESKEDGSPELQYFGPVQTDVLHQINLNYLITVINKKLGRELANETVDKAERALLAGIEPAGKNKAWTIGESLDELMRLAETAGAVVIGKFAQRKERPDAALFLGKGKVQEIALTIQDTDADLLIIDDELTPSQQRNLEQILGIKVLDRTALILDIFAQRARSNAGKLQVRLAQLKYNLPRIGGKGLVLSRLGGGIGTRGPGETKLEVDRRRIYAQIHDIETQLTRLSQQRQLHRSQRKETRIPLVALVGYTNAGKSTLLNALTGADVFTEDKLFATLDPTTRLVTLPQKQKILLTDTVGFIQKLPHTLVSAFHATLEEVEEADLLLHVVDCSNEDYELQIEAVIEVLKELNSENKPMMYVFNKADELKTRNVCEKMLRGRDGIFISAQSGENLSGLLEKIEAFFQEQQVKMKLCIPFSEGGLVTKLHGIAQIYDTDYTDKGTVLQVSLPISETAAFEQYKI
jgi:GTPase